jgi:hypothetical protein
MREVLAYFWVLIQYLRRGTEENDGWLASVQRIESGPSLIRSSDSSHASAMFNKEAVNVKELQSEDVIGNGFVLRNTFMLSNTGTLRFGSGFALWQWALL